MRVSFVTDGKRNQGDSAYRMWSPATWGMSGYDQPWYWRVMRRLWWRVKWPRGGGTRRVLLVAKNRLMFDYADDVRALMQDDDRIRFAGTSTRMPAQSADVKEACDVAGIAYVNPAWASSRWWDMVVLADHGTARLLNPRIPKLFNYHGLDGSKTLAGSDEPYRYARRHVLDGRGRPVYTRMFDASEHSRAEAVRRVPALDGVVVVTGDLRVDRMLAMDRMAVRERLGIGRNETTVLLGSTFGTESLLESEGMELIEAARRLSGRYRFILSAHPNHWQPREDGRPPLGPMLLRYRDEGFVVHEQPGDLMPYMVAADATIADFGSLAVNYALLRRPLAFVTFPGDVVSPQSIVWRLYEAAPHLESPEDLDPMLERLFADGPSAALAGVASQIVSCPGEAAKRMRDQIYALLRLSPRVWGGRDNCGN